MGGKRGLLKQTFRPYNGTPAVPHGSGTLHSKLSGFYSSRAPGGGRIRDWVSTKSFDEQYEFGTKTLERFFKTEP